MHRGFTVTESNLRRHFNCLTLTPYIKAFVGTCVHCLSTLGGDRFPHPFGPVVHGDRPNSLLQFDYLELGPGDNGDKYVLMLRDYHSNYVWMFTFAGNMTENAAHTIIDWCSAFGIPIGLMSDGPTHFRNETIRLVTKA